MTIETSTGTVSPLPTDDFSEQVDMVTEVIIAAEEDGVVEDDELAEIRAISRISAEEHIRQVHKASRLMAEEYTSPGEEISLLQCVRTLRLQAETIQTAIDKLDSEKVLVSPNVRDLPCQVLRAAYVAQQQYARTQQPPRVPKTNLGHVVRFFASIFDA